MECPTAAAVQKATCHAQEGGQTLPGAGVGGGILGGFPGIQRAAGKSDLLHVNGMKGLGEGGGNNTLRTQGVFLLGESEVEASQRNARVLGGRITIHEGQTKAGSAEYWENEKSW